MTARALHRAQLLLDHLDVGGRRRVDLVDHQHVGHARHRFAGVMGGDLPRAQRVGDGDVQVRLHKRKVVVAAVPDDDVGFVLRQPQNLGVVHAREHHVAGCDVRLVLLPLLGGAACGIEIGRRCEALHARGGEIAVRHRMPQHDNPQPLLP